MPHKASADNRSAMRSPSGKELKRGKRGGNRGRKRKPGPQRAEQQKALIDKIQRIAKLRQHVQAEGRPNAVAKLTTELNGRDHVLRPEGLFAERRDLDAGTMEPGNPKVSQAFRLLHEYGKRSQPRKGTKRDHRSA